MSLRARVAILVVLAFATVLSVVGFVVPGLIRSYLVKELDAQLEQARFAGPGLVFVRSDNGRFRGPAATFAGAYVEARTTDGELLTGGFVDETNGDDLGVPELPETIDPSRLDQPFTVGSTDDDTEWRVLVVASAPFPGGTNTQGSPTEPTTPPGFLDDVGMITIALPTAAIDATVSQVVRIELIAGGVSVVVLAGAAWFLAGLGLAPLRRLERSAAAITGTSQLDQRVDHPSERTELGRLGVTLNSMLARLQTGFDAQQKVEAKLRRFVSDASHELRTPLTSIRGYAELYRRGGDQPDQVARSMGRIEDEATRMTRLVDDLLALARLDEGSPLELSSVEVRSLVDGLANDARVVATDREITVRGPASCVVQADRFRLAQAVANLVTNARIHTPAGTPIEVVVTDGGDAVSIAVVDHGGGIDDSSASRVFDRFYRADPSRSRQQGGSGLGLAITAAIVHAHGGTIEATPTESGGATFTIEVPTLTRCEPR